MESDWKITAWTPMRTPVGVKIQINSSFLLLLGSMDANWRVFMTQIALVVMVAIAYYHLYLTALDSKVLKSIF